MKRKNQEPQEMSVYALISQDGTTVYVGKTARGNEYNAYKEHARYRKTETADFFRSADTEQTYPKMYLLTETTQTQQGAYRYCVAWTRYFLEHGMTSLSYPKTQAYAMDLLPETEEIYDQIKDIPVDAVLDETKILVASYKKMDKSAPKTPKNEIKISVSHREYEEIQRKAKSCRLSMSRYCKNMALEGRIMTLESPPLCEYLSEVRGAKVILRQVLYAIYTNGKYYHADLENIQKMIDRITETINDLSADFRDNTDVLMRLLPK